MQRTILWLACLVSFFALIFNTQPARAHESITVGDYTIEVGWLNEPPVAGQHNAIVVNVSSAQEQPMEDVSALTVTLSYGGQEKTLDLRPLDDHSPGQFMSPLLPTVAGEYTVIFGGSLGETTVDVETHVEEVQPADTLAFPVVDPAQPQTRDFGGADWLAVAGFVTGAAGLLVSLVALRKSR